jgi:hypothetical protein
MLPKAVVLSLTLLTLSLYLFKLGGYAISLALIFNVFYLISNPILRSHLNVFIVFFLFFVFNLLYQFWAVNILEFLKTFALFTLAIFNFLNFGRLSEHFFDSKALKFTVKICALITITVAILQIAEFLFLGTTTYYSFLDSISINTAKSAGRFQAVNFLSYIRPISLYHEPSYYGSVLLVLFISSIKLKMHFLWKMLTLLGIVLSLSMTVYFFTLVFLIFTFRKNKIILGLFVVIALFLFNGSDILDLLRVREISVQGSSGNERLIAPIYAIIYEFTKVYTIFGRALGQTEKQLDNSFFVLFSYFGILFPLLLYFIWLYIKKYLPEFSSQLVFVIYFFNVLFVNGAIITPESQFMLFFLFLVLRFRLFEGTKKTIYNKLI